MLRRTALWGWAIDLIGRAATATTCGVPQTSQLEFCQGVTWNASLPLPPAELDAAARDDYAGSMSQLARDLQSPGPCQEAWKAVQCASKFPKCSVQISQQKVCRTLCMQFANACNASDAVLAQCYDNLLYDDPPCTDYAPLLADRSVDAHGVAIWPAPSPSELFDTVAGLPVLLAILAVVLHATHYFVQCLCGGGDSGHESARRAASARERLHDTFVEPLGSKY